MLDFMRKHASSWFVTGIIGAIVVVFVLWGIGSFRSAQFQEVAEVDGAKIYLPEYYKAYQNLVRNYQEQMGGEFNEEVAKTLRLREQALGQMIDELLIKQASNRLGLNVTDAELRDYIRRNPAFADERGFNEKRYHQLLARRRLPASEYEEQERQQLLVQKMVHFITSFAKISEADLQEAYRLQQETVRVEYVVLGPSQFLKEQQAGAAEMQQYYESHPETFREPEKVKVRYIFFKFNDFDGQIKADREKIETYYYDHLEDYSRPQTIRVSQLFLEPPSKAGTAEQQRFRLLAEKLLQRARAGESFEQLQKKYSPEAEGRIQAGELGLVKRGQNIPEWEAVAFHLKKGGIGMAKTPKGYYLIKVNDILERKTPPLAEVQAQVEKSWRAEEAKKLAHRQAEGLRAEMLNASFAEAAAARHIKVQETGWLTSKDAIPGLGQQPAFSQMAIGLKPQEISKPLNLADGVALLQVMDHQDSLLPPLAQIKNRVAEAIRLEKARLAAAEEAESILSRLQKGESLAKVAAQKGVPLKDSGFFTRSQGMPGQGQVRELATAAFSLAATPPHHVDLVSWGGENYLLVFKERRQPSREQFALAREELSKGLIDLKRQMVFSQWLASERQRAKIKVYEIPS
ncbi:MAG TPA: hypothetical protein DCY27_14690 [Desulfobacterales bacterium]|nr:hypothetical protein [Desulfobacterales bacterium]